MDDPKKDLNPELFTHSSFIPLDQVKSKVQIAEELNELLQLADKQHLDVVTAIQNYFAWYATWRWRPSFKSHRGLKREVQKIRESITLEMRTMEAWRKLSKHATTQRRIDSMLDGSYELYRDRLSPDRHVENFRHLSNRYPKNDVEE